MSVDQERRSSMTIGSAVPSLVRWRLSSDADLVFRTLTTIGPRDARGLAAELGLPRRRIDRALAELRTAEALTPGPAGHRRAPLWRGRPPAEVVATLQRLRLAELMGAERCEHLSINTEQSIDAASARAGAPLGRQVIERGVRVRALGLPHGRPGPAPRRRAVRPDIILTDRERELIALLARGHTDVSAATQMRVSGRLITKMMRALMDRAGVDNRFQLGLALGAARSRVSSAPSES
jgi:DNA-binding CsgD family transcriptional regulator